VTNTNKSLILTFVDLLLLKQFLHVYTMRVFEKIVKGMRGANNSTLFEKT
jgi:hypothetical protein